MPTLSLHQPPHNTSLMGVVEGAARHFGLDHGTPWLYGASGHAFLINVHEQLCPSSPYVWRADGFTTLLGNLGLRMVDHGYVDTNTNAAARGEVEQAVRAALDAGHPASVCNMDHQLIAGYDDTGFLLTQPWGPEVPVTPPHLSFGTWAEMGDEIHMNFFTWEPIAPAEELKAVLDSFAYAVDLHRGPDRYSFPAYGIGPDAFASWQAALAEHGTSHGAWWNATVWTECRTMAARYLEAVVEHLPDLAEDVRALADRYYEIAAALGRLTDKALPPAEQHAALERAAGIEAAAVARMARVLEAQTVRSAD